MRNDAASPRANGITAVRQFVLQTPETSLHRGAGNFAHDWQTRRNVFTDAGNNELQTIDVAAAARKTQELRQKRAKAQGNRPHRNFGRKGPKQKVTAPSPHLRRHKAVLKSGAQSTRETVDDVQWQACSSKES